MSDDVLRYEELIARLVNVSLAAVDMPWPEGAAWLQARLGLSDEGATWLHDIYLRVNDLYGTPVTHPERSDVDGD